MKVKFSVVGVLLISLFTVVNIVKSNQKNKKIEDIMLVNVESLAFPEGGIGSDMRIATKHVCYLNNEVFDESTGRLEHIPVEGRIGICDGTEGHVEVDHAQKSGYNQIEDETTVFIYISSFCCIGCQRNTLQGPIPTIAMHPDSCLKSLDISVMMKDSIEVIKLETTDSCLIGFINKISFTDKYILVSDARVSQKIYLFDKEGKFIRYISNKGNGPGEYSVIGDFTIKGDSVFIQDYYQNKYVVYDMVADEIKDDIPYNAHHSGVVALDNYLYFISNYFTSPIGDYNCFRYDLSMRKTEGYLPFTADRIANEPAWTINHPCGRIDKLKSFAYYRSNDTIYQIDKLTVSPQCVIHFPNGEDRTSSTQGGHISGIVHLQQSAGYILGTYTEGKGLRYFLIDKRDYSSQMGKLLRFNSLDRKSINNEFFIEDNYLIFWDTMQSLKLWRRYFDKAEFTNPADKQRIQSIIDLSQDDDNPVIFRCRVK